MPRRADVEEIAKAVDDAFHGNRSALARLLTYVEARGEAAYEVGRVLRGRLGRAWTIGITGAPGAGKSTLTDRLVTEMLRTENSDRPGSGMHDAAVPWVSVLAVDPSSPFSGGAILGDRVRMQDHATDPRVFIRSMATRGHLGGLAAAVPQAARLLDAIGSAFVVIETVGVGQAELEVAGHADTTVVVVNPGWGDAVQANKAGLMEIADVFVVNKADRGGAEETASEIQSMLMMAIAREWQPPVIVTSGVSNVGADALWAAVGAHRAFVQHDDAGPSRTAVRRTRAADEIRALMVEIAVGHVEALATSTDFDAAVDAVVRGELDAYSAAVRCTNRKFE